MGILFFFCNIEDFCLWNKDFCGFVIEMEKYMCQYNYINYLQKFREIVWKHQASD